MILDFSVFGDSSSSAPFSIISSPIPTPPTALIEFEFELRLKSDVVVVVVIIDPLLAFEWSRFRLCCLELPEPKTSMAALSRSEPGRERVEAVRMRGLEETMVKAEEAAGKENNWYVPPIIVIIIIAQCTSAE